jgi:membrane fusion protein, heavy metal efflux system
MRFSIPEILRKYGLAVMICGLFSVAVVGRGSWWPSLTGWITQTIQSRRIAPDHDSEDAAADHHDSGNSLPLTRQGRLNLGLTDEFVQPLRLQTYRRHLTLPAMIVERPGRSRVHVSTPLTGIITHVHSNEGEAVVPGALLFEIQLTHEDLVQSQSRFLQSLGEIDVEQRELARLRDIVSSGAAAGRLALEREYEIEKLTALLVAQREALRLHGLSDTQIAQVESERRLLKSLRIFAPYPDRHPEDEHAANGTRIRERSSAEDREHPLIVQNLKVAKGRSVQAGDPLCELADYSELYIEGHAFSQDADDIIRAATSGWPLDAILDDSRDGRELKNLEFAYLDHRIDPGTRSLSVFVQLHNELLRDEKHPDGRRFLTWRFRPGQRPRLRVPVDEWENQFVLPIEAVARDGAEYYVFQENGNRFDRVPVHVKYKDQLSVVVANDGSLFPGDVVALRGANQMQIALRSRSGDGADPHAGHTH